MAIGEALHVSGFYTLKSLPSENFKPLLRTLLRTQLLLLNSTDMAPSKNLIQ